ncbi:MAG: DUF1192 domain-containing protein [Pseudobdellovibrionaceae bacterium]
MFDDDDQPRNKPAQLKNLEPMSLPELREYIEALKGEIARAEAEITRKEAVHQAASSFFKTSDE